MNSYTKLIFDLDNTLIENKENIRFAFFKLMEVIGKQADEKDFEEFYRTDNDFWEAWQRKEIKIPDEYNTSIIRWKNWLRARRFQLFFKNQIQIEQASEFNEIYMQYLMEKVIPIRDVKEVIQKLSKQYEIIVATNGPLLAIPEKLKKIGIQQYVTTIFSAEEVGAMKPEKEFYKGLMKKVGDEKVQRYLAIGDSLLSDIKGANQMKIDCIWFNPKAQQLEKGYYPQRIITSLRELLEIL